MKILIIGSKGFIGSYCQRYFNSIGYIVFSADIYTDKSTSNYFELSKIETNFSEIFKISQPDFCINCSGSASVPDSYKNPEQDFNLNTSNVYKILNAIRNHSSQTKFINLSSAAVYGNPKYLPIDENHPTNPISVYGHNKLLAEQICTQFSKIYGIQTCSVRIFSAYGIGLKKQIFWDLFQKFSANPVITLMGNASDSRDFIHVHDLVIALHNILITKNLEHTVVNVASGEETTIGKIAEIYKNFFGQSYSYSFDGVVPMGYPTNWCADTSFLKKMGFGIVCKFENEIIKFLEWAEKEK